MPWQKACGAGCRRGRCRGSSFRTNSPSRRWRRASTASSRLSQATNSTVSMVSAKSSSISARVSGAARKMRASRFAPSRSATARKSSAASGSIFRKKAPRPLLSRYCPSLPDGAGRCGRDRPAPAPARYPHASGAGRDAKLALPLPRLRRDLPDRPELLVAGPQRFDAAADVGIPLLARLAGQDIALSQQGRKLAGERAAAKVAGAQDHMGKARMHAERGHVAAMRRDLAVAVQRAQPAQQVAGLRIGGAGGGSSQRRSAGSLTPHCASSSASGARSAASISGAVWSGSARCCPCGQSR